METKVWFFLHPYGRVEQLHNEMDIIKPFIVSNEAQRYDVFVFDWKRSMESNTIIRIENRTKNLKCDSALIITNRFSTMLLNWLSI